MKVRGGGWERGLGGGLGSWAARDGGGALGAELNTHPGASTLKRHAANLSIQSGHRPLPSRHQLGPPSLGVSSLTSQLHSLTSQNSRGELSPKGNKSGLFGTKPHT